VDFEHKKGTSKAQSFLRAGLFNPTSIPAYPKAGHLNMRLLSLGIVFALLFSTYVTSVPINDGENQLPTEGTSTAPEASGSGSGGFNWDDIDTSHKEWGWIKTGNQVGII
jgi:hypothetical protein